MSYHQGQTHPWVKPWIEKESDFELIVAFEASFYNIYFQQ